MKTMKPGFLTGISYVAILIFAACFLGSCSRKIAFETSPVVPAAEGSVKIKKDDNNNYTIDLNIIRLAEPDRLQPPRETYVVWMETQNNDVRNIGQLKTSSGLLSNKLRSSLKTVSPYKPRKFFITAENSQNPEYPRGEIVLTTGNFRVK